MQLITDTDGKAAIGETADAANLSLNLPANFYNFWKNTSGEPFTVIMLSRRIGNSPSAAVNLVTWGNVNYAPFRIPAGSPPAHYNNFFASTAVGVYTDAPSTSWESLASTFTGTSVRFYQNGSEDASSPQAINASTCGAAAAINMLNMLWREIAVYQRVLSTAERNGIENGMRMRWGLSAV